VLLLWDERPPQREIVESYEGSQT